MSKSAFISYSTDDTQIAEQIRDSLEATGLTCWMAPRDIAPGLDYGTQIIDAIEACTVLVLVLSESSNYSIYVRKEVERAIAKGKVIIPVRIQEVAISRSLEFFISDAQWIDAWDSLLSTAIIALHRAVSGHLANRGADVNASATPAPRSSLAAELLPSPTHSPSPTHQPPPVERALFVGREPQMAELESALAQSLQGHGQLRFVTGEAGAGKSALLNEFQFRAREQDAHLFIASGACDAQTGIADPYLPFREILSALARQEGGRAVLLEHGPDLIDTLIPGSALGSHRSGQGRAPDAKPVEQSQIFEQAVKVLQTVAQRTPLLLILEDLHWVDEASIGLLFRLGRQLEGSRILVLGTYRSEEVSLGRNGESHPLQKSADELRRILGTIHIDLDAAGETEGLTLVDALLDAEPNWLDAAFRQALHEHTGGHPLFVVELLRDLQSDGGLIQNTNGEWIVGPDLNWSALPDRIEGIIAVRMDRLDAEERQLLTTASILGEHFIAEAVALALKIDGRHVAQQLSGPLQKQHKLVQMERVERLGRQRITHFRFSHNLMQVYLCEQLDESERSFLHEDVGYVLEELYGEQAHTMAVQLARHFQAAELPEKAVGYLISAGEQAARLSAHSEALDHFNQALMLLADLPKGEERDRQELTIQFNRGELLTVRQVMGAQAAGEAYIRAVDLARFLGMRREMVQALMPLTWNALFRGEPEVARRYGQECLEVAEMMQDPELLMLASSAMYLVLSTQGWHGEAAATGERAIAFFRTHRPNLTFDEAGNLAIMLGFTALSLVPVGYPDRALQYVQEGLALAQRHEHLFMINNLTGLVAAIHNLRRDWQEGLQFGQAMQEHGNTHNIPMGHMFGGLHQSAGIAMLGDVDKGIQFLRQALDQRDAHNVKAGVAAVQYLAQMGEACGQVGRVSEGLVFVKEALVEMESNHDHQWEPKVHQIHGDLLLMQALPPKEQATAQQEAEACFRRAIEIAQEGGAKLWEARAMASLCRLLEQQGRGVECRAELAKLYAWFTEGFETEDLRVVKEVLDATGETK